MKLESIELIKRKGGYFHFRNKLIPAIRKGDGIGVGCVFIPSIVDRDFSLALGSNRFLWFPKANEIEDILKAMGESDYKTAHMLPIKSSWGGVRPRTVKVADFL